MEATATAALAGQPTENLIEVARTLDANPARTEAERMTLAWVSDELLRRFPQATAALNEWAADMDATATYTETLLAEIAR